MAESVDALVSNTSGATHPGSIPGLGTKTEKVEKLSPFSFLPAAPLGVAHSTATKSKAKFQYMKKYIANIVTGSRIAFSLPLLFIPLSSGWFYALYIFCGLTDMIDGTIARKTGAVSNFGSRLDTIADFVFMLVCSIKILP